MTCHDFLEEVDALALGAVSPGQAVALQRHRLSCERCDLAFNRSLRAVDALPLIAPLIAAPASLRASVLSVVDAPSAAEPDRQRQTAVHSRADRPASGLRPVAEAGAASAVLPADRSGTPHRHRRTMRWPHWPALAAAALVLVVAGLSAWTYSLKREVSELRHAATRSNATDGAPAVAAQHAALLLLSSSDTVTARLMPPDGSVSAVGAVIWNAKQKQCVVLAGQFAPLSPRQEYHLWFRSGAKRWDGGQLVRDAAGAAEAVVSMERWPLDAGYRISVVVQPRVDDGSRQPVLSGEVQ